MCFSEALDAVERLVEAGQGGSVFTPNVDHVVTAERNPDFAAAYGRVSLSFADGMPLVWASRALGEPLPGRVAGSDLVPPLLERAGQRGWRCYFLGARPGVAQKAAGIAQERWGTNVVGVSAPMVNADDARQLDAIASAISATKAHLVFMAMGAPKQELVIDRIAGRIRPAVALGIGASLDFIAGTARRAPEVLQKAGLEWLYRFAQEPGRLWKRYLVDDPSFAWIVLREAGQALSRKGKAESLRR
jgi:N-acetylglucosaminyldiphosphoundecaprenol N-acetyl-beta-D-mannosaminyltransferase